MNTATKAFNSSTRPTHGSLKFLICAALALVITIFGVRTITAGMHLHTLLQPTVLIQTAAR